MEAETNATTADGLAGEMEFGESAPPASQRRNPLDYSPPLPLHPIHLPPRRRIAFLSQEFEVCPSRARSTGRPNHAARPYLPCPGQRRHILHSSPALRSHILHSSPALRSLAAVRHGFSRFVSVVVRRADLSLRVPSRSTCVAAQPRQFSRLCGCAAAPPFSQH